MEEKISNGEQPKDLNVQTAEAGNDNGILNSSEGSPLGKFKNSESLLDAYNELQSEFTRKCQKLSETEKKLQENIETNPENVNKNIFKEFAWNKNFDEFMQSHKNASSFLEDISNEIINDENLKSAENGLETAYYRVIEKKYMPENELVKNQNFLEKYIYNNEEIKNKIIKEYVTSLQDVKNPINVSNSGVTMGIASGGNRVNSLEDAKSVVEKMFKF